VKEKEKIKEFKPKKKRCKACPKMFLPARPLQVVCDYKCAQVYAEAKGKKKEEREKLIQEIDDKLWKIRKKELREETKKKSEYEKELQDEINTIVRLIDFGHPCISSGRTKYKPHAGHYFAVGGSPTVRFNLLNIFNQSDGDNVFKGGKPREYAEGLRKVFGQEVFEEIEGLKRKYPVLKLSIPELKEKIKLARKIVRELKKQVEGEEKPFNTEERISMRRKLNQLL
jgi:hypothetical protein